MNGQTRYINRNGHNAERQTCGRVNPGRADVCKIYGHGRHRYGQACCRVHRHRHACRRNYAGDGEHNGVYAACGNACRKSRRRIVAYCGTERNATHSYNIGRGGRALCRDNIHFVVVRAHNF